MVCLGALLAGCYPRNPHAPEENHPLIQQAIARKASSPREAVRLLERALEGNPRLALAHWELGLLCLNATSNYAAAVYHFQKVLELRPDWPQATTARQLISNAKLELVKEGVEAPTIPSVQRQMDRLVEELHRLTEQRTNLLVRLESLTVVTQQLAAENLELRQQWLAQGFPAPSPGSPGHTAPSPSPNAARGATRPPGALAPASLNTLRPGSTPAGASRGGPSPSVSAATRPGSALAGRAPAGSLSRFHTVQRGETAFAISRRYGITVRELVEANPRLDPARLKAGQRLSLPTH